jgi:hypothetical protein
LRLGFEFTTDIKESLEQRFQTEPEVDECIKALKSLAEQRAVPLSTYRDWKEQTEIRFGTRYVEE